MANGNPSGLGVFEFNLRLPGQYFDKETNLHYNYFRDYDPGIGRYIESDPIGLEGGLNTYSYTKSSPLAHSDPLGLLVRLCSRPLKRLPIQIGRLRHEFIDLNGTDWGFYCVGSACPIFGRGQVLPNIEARPFRNCMTWDCINESTLQANILASQSSPPSYDLFCSNCQNWAIEMLTRSFDKTKCTFCGGPNNVP